MQASVEWILLDVTNQENEMSTVGRPTERAGSIGELVVFYYAGGKFGVDSYETIYQDFGYPRDWVECPNDRVRAHAVAIGVL